MQGVAAKNDASYDLSRACASVTGQTTIAASTATPQHGPYDLPSARFDRIQNDQTVARVRNVPTPERNVLDEHARVLSGVKAQIA